MGQVTGARSSGGPGTGGRVVLGCASSWGLGCCALVGPAVSRGGTLAEPNVTLGRVGLGLGRWPRGFTRRDFGIAKCHVGTRGAGAGAFAQVLHAAGLWPSLLSRWDAWSGAASCGPRGGAAGLLAGAVAGLWLAIGTLVHGALWLGPAGAGGGGPGCSPGRSPYFSGFRPPALGSCCGVPPLLFGVPSRSRGTAVGPWRGP